MKEPSIPKWLSRIVAYSGGGGLFAVAFLDSSVLSFPFVTDLLYMQFVIERPAFTAYYVAMATLGSLAGCIWLYFLSKKGGEAYQKRHASSEPGRIQKLVNRHAFLSIFLPAILPPPTPFKAFVIGEGVAQVPMQTFVMGVLAGRGLRYLVEGILAIEYGRTVERVMMHNKALVIVTPITLIFGIYLLKTLLSRPAKTGN